MRLAFLLPALLFFAACGTTELPPNRLSGTSWQLVALVEHGDSLTTVPPDKLAFQTDSGVRLQSCNNCVGLYAFDDDGLTMERLACTRRACPADRIELARYLDGRNAYAIVDDLLQVGVDDDINGIDARLYFRRYTPADTTEGL